MPVKVEDPRVLRPALERDWLINATTIARLFYPTDSVWDAYVDNLESPKGIMLRTRDKNLSGKVGLEFRVWEDEVHDELGKVLNRGETCDIGASRSNTIRWAEDRFRLDRNEPCVFVALKDPSALERTSGVDVEPLVEKDADKVDRHWGLATNRRDFFANRIRNGPAMGVRRDDELVAWMGTYFITDKVAQLGYLHVMEDHRRKGLARSVVTAMCLDMADRDLMPTAYVFEDNHPSLGLFLSLGFEKVDRQAWMGGTFNG